MVEVAEVTCVIVFGEGEVHGAVIFIVVPAPIDILVHERALVDIIKYSSACDAVVGARKSGEIDLKTTHGIRHLHNKGACFIKTLASYAW